MFSKTIAILTFICLCIKALAIPARPGIILLEQPDGNIVRAEIRGDEFGGVLVSEDGCALIRSTDGFICYAYYDSEGNKFNSGCHFGKGASPSIISASRRVPYSVISGKALQKRILRDGQNTMTKSSGTKVKALIIPAQFKDLSFSYSKKDFDKLVSEIKDYFDDQFLGLNDFEFVMSSVVTLPEEYSYYGRNEAGADSNAAGAVVDACKLADMEIDFSEFDNDGDGVVDNVYLFFAGPDEADGAGDDYIWSQSWDVQYAGYKLTLDGVYVGRYAASAELMYANGTYRNFTGIGPFCHEFAHLLGLVDLYDTDDENSGGSTEGVWGLTSLMDLGAYNNDKHTPPGFNALEREMLGIADIEYLSPGNYELEPIDIAGKVMKVAGEYKDEYYLIEVRRMKGWDKYIGGSGMLVYHVDKSARDAGYSTKHKTNLTASQRWAYNQVNCNPTYMCAKILPAERPEGSQVISSIFYPGIGGKYTEVSITSSCNFKLENIAKSLDSVTFTVAGSITLNNKDVYQDGVILGWSLENGANNPDTYVYCSEAGSLSSPIRVMSSGNNTYSTTINGLKPDTEYFLEISAPDNSGGVDIYETQFRTAKIYPDAYPFIFLNRADRYMSGNFKKGAKIPLRLYNPQNVESQMWYFDGSEISVDPSTGYFVLEKSGILYVEVKYKGGTQEIITKEVTVK